MSERRRVLLVDAFNLLHAVPRLRAVLRAQGPGPALDRLVAVLVHWSQDDPRRRVVLVCDGARPRGVGVGPPAPGLELRFAGDADRVLLELLERGAERLVSDDGELVCAASRLGVPTASPRSWFEAVEERVRDLARAEARAPELGPAEVREWLEVFGAAEPPPTPRPAPEPPLGPEEVREWLRFFGEEPPPD
ncbi:MAG: hypothetical protein D6731_11830 [Planctomycetota bacterium]|nr:MAG: hypothetical protein D6731_11830 [Planctomycetota bacterium]